MKNLNNIGINNEYLPIGLFNTLKEQIEIFKGRIGNQRTLAGNIKEEWNLDKITPLFNDYILSLINKSNIHTKYVEKEIMKFAEESKKPSLKLYSMWVNFQKKHEFNPIHDHAGLFSFIIFIQIPYNVKEELKNGPGALSNNNCASCLQFTTYDYLGKSVEFCVPVDKSYEGGIYFFNAKTKHCVYPFYTSDDYRITVSGNIGWYIK